MPTPTLPAAPVITMAEAYIAAPAANGAPGSVGLVQTYIDAATAVCEDIVGSILLKQVSKTFDGGRSAIALPFRLNTNYDVTVTEFPNVITDFYVVADGTIVRGGVLPIGRPFFAGYQNITIAGWSGLDQKVDAQGNLTYPANIKLAVTEQFRFMWNIGKVAPRPAYAQEGAYGEVTPSGFLVPHRVMELLAPSRTMQGYGFA